MVTAKKVDMREGTTKFIKSIFRNYRGPPQEVNNKQMVSAFISLLNKSSKGIKMRNQTTFPTLTPPKIPQQTNQSNLNSIENSQINRYSSAGSQNNPTMYPGQPYAIPVNVSIETPEISLYKKKKEKEDENLDFPSKNKLSVLVQIPEGERINELRGVEESFSPAPNVVSRIFWDEKKESLFYLVSEPQLMPEDLTLLRHVESMLEQKLDIVYGDIRFNDAYIYLDKKVDELVKDYKIKITERQRDLFRYYIYRDFIGLGKLEPLMKDANIEDISCDGIGFPVYIVHRNPKYGSILTNIIFDTKDDLDSFIIRLAQKCGRSISVAEPLLDGSLPEGSRVQATFGTDIAMRGSNFSIRKFTEKPLSITNLVNTGSVNSEIAAYLWYSIENQKSVLVAGATAAGKTTFLNALAGFIRKELKVVTIEDTAELQLPLPNWVPEIARVGFGPEQYGEVTMYDLLKASMRQRPDYLIVGETRGIEASVMFQAMATGHPSMSTIHADSLKRVVDRLTTRPIDLPKSLIQNIDIIVFVSRIRRSGSYIRRVTHIYEILDYNVDTQELENNLVFEWDPKNDSFITYKSAILRKMVKARGVSESDVQEEIFRRTKVIEWLKNNNVHNYKDVSYIINMYYQNPEKVLTLLDQKS